MTSRSAATAQARRATRTAEKAPPGDTETDIRWFPPPEPAIVPATDLGSVVTLKHGNLFLLTDPFGDVHADSRGLGLYHGDTRILSWCVLRIGGQRPSLLQAGSGGNYRGTVELTNPDFLEPPAAGEPELGVALALPQRSLGIQRERVLGGALLERLAVSNYTTDAEVVEVGLELAADAADIFEVRGFPREHRGTLEETAVRHDRITFRATGRDGVERMTHIALSAPAAIGPVAGDGDHAPAGCLRASWRLVVPAGGRRVVEWRVWPTERPSREKGRPGSPGRPSRPALAALFPEPPLVRADQGAAAYRAWTSSSTDIDTDNQIFSAAIRRSLIDLRLLVNDGPEPGERYVAAGVPWFSTLFGRDTIITALQMLPFRPQIAVEALGVLAARQATAVDDWRDAEPGKILHELRTGEMARAGEVPFSPYYGTVDATPLWLILLGATFDWTGDLGLVDRLWPNVLAALEWIDRWGDRDGDALVEYQRRTDGGFYNMGWKDSPDGIRDRRGVIASLPVALAEVQGYVYDARLRIAQLARLRGETELADRLERQAGELRARFNEAFWVADQAYYAMALDGEKRPADAIASNVGHCLWSGIVEPERARQVADRMLAPDLFSGWGLRTYAAGQPGYNPVGYHTGTVWPHDTSIAAAGLKRYGFHDEANRLVTGIFEAAQRFPDGRLPELFCGFERNGEERADNPVPYPVACSPQAWAAGSTFQFLQTMLGLRASAHRRELELWRPHLPAFLSRATVTNLRVGDAAVDLLFHRWRGTTSAEVLRKVGDIDVVIRL